MAYGRKEHMVSKALLIKWYDTNLRSALIAFAITVATAVVDVLYTQLNGGRFDWHLVIGAGVAAGVKFLHSALSRAELDRLLTTMTAGTQS